MNPEFGQAVAAALDEMGPSFEAAARRYGIAPAMAAIAEFLAAGVQHPVNRKFLLRRIVREVGWRGIVAGAVLGFRVKRP